MRSLSALLMFVHLVGLALGVGGATVRLTLLLWCRTLLMLAWLGAVPASGLGILLAIVSGAVTSGLGYVVWYGVLPRLAVTSAAVAQLSVPTLPAVGAVAVLGESLSGRVVLARVAVLSGIALVVVSRAAV